MDKLIRDLTNVVNQNIDTFIEEICNKYSLDSSELNELWNSQFSEQKKKESKPKPQKKALTDVDTTDISPERLSKCNKQELMALCKSHGHKVTGKKEDLISRLLETTGNKDNKDNKDSSQENKPKTTTNKPAKKTNNTSEILKKLQNNCVVVSIRKNKYGNHEHPETNLVFDMKTEKVYGKQQDDGTVSDLTDEDIEQCKRYKFQYEIPSNLDQNTGLDDVVIEELNEDDIIIEDSDEDEDNSEETEEEMEDE